MLNQRTTFIKYILFIVAISLLLSSCGNNKDLPDGAEYFEPIWFENLSEYSTGNHNKMYEFRNGHAVVSFAQMGKYWDVSNESWGVIDKSGQFIIGPLDGDLEIAILDDDNFYVEDNETFTSKIVNIDNKLVASFNGILTDGKNYAPYLEPPNKYGVYFLENDSGYGLVKTTGQVIVPCKYYTKISDITDEYLVFQKDTEGKILDVYNPNGSFSHTINSERQLLFEYSNGLFRIRSRDDLFSYGVADIYGNIIIEPNYDRIQIISDNYIIVDDYSENGCQLLNKEGKLIKTLELDGIVYGATEINNDVFMISDTHGNAYLITSKWEIIKKYDNGGSARYCGDGVFSITSGFGSSACTQLIDGATGDFIGEKYDGRREIIFNDGYAEVEDLDGNMFVIDKAGNKYCEGYTTLGAVTDRVVRISTDTTVGIICLPPIK